MQFVCRTCMSSDELRPLFPVKLKYHTFQRALFLCTGLQIMMDDGLPQTICKACAMFIKSAIQFRNKSHASEVKLKQGLKHPETNYKGTKLKSNSPTEICMKEKILDPPQNTGVIIPKTEQINLNFESCADNDNIDAVSSSNDDLMFKEEQVEIEITTEPIENKEIKIVITKDSDRETYMDLVETSNDPENPRQCKICKKTMRTLTGIRNHVIRHSLGYRFLCELCGSSHTSQIHVLRHQRAMHGLARDDSFPCAYCDYKALDREMLEVHERRIHTKERPFVCDDCGEAFYSKRVLKQHFIIHSTDKPFQCNLCQHNFKSKSRLSGHIFKVHREKKYKYTCPYCPKTYYKTYSCRKHIQKVHGVPRDQQGKLQRVLINQESAEVQNDNHTFK